MTCAWTGTRALAHAAPFRYVRPAELDEVKLNAIGMMVLDEDGKLKMHKVGRRRGIAKGVAGGGDRRAVGRLPHHAARPPDPRRSRRRDTQALPMSDQDRDRLARELENGKAALGVLVKLEQRDAVSEKLAELGGSPEQTLELTPELEAAAAEVPEYEAQCWPRGASA